ncbi:MAG: HAD family hydrolase [Eubacteriales bacterium]
MKQRYDGILFDLDGTLWDATGVTADTWKTVLARHPDVRCALPMTQETVQRYMGLTNEELARIFFPELAYEDAFALMKESCALENEWLPVRGGILYDGTAETLARLKADGYRLFIVSNCQAGYIEAFLQAHGFAALFEDIECSGNTGLCKADNLRLVMERCGLNHPVYVGDTVSDSTAARTAGLPFVYAKYGFGERFGRGRTDDYDAAVGTIREIEGLLAQRSLPCKNPISTPTPPIPTDTTPRKK